MSSCGERTEKVTTKCLYHPVCIPPSPKITFPISNSMEIQVYKFYILDFLNKMSRVTPLTDRDFLLVASETLFRIILASTCSCSWKIQKKYIKVHANVYSIRGNISI